VAEPTPAPVTDAPAGEDVDLNDCHQEILRALLELGADSKRRRQPTLKIAHAIEVRRESNYYKKPLAALVEKKLVKSKKGPGGGYWLTESGKSQAQRLDTSRPE
jgi:predicted transcriptional regulator